MLIENEIFYHIHTYSNVPTFEINKEYSVFEESNFFWKFFEEMRLSSYDGLYNAPALFAEHSYMNKQISIEGLQYISNSLKEAGMFIRELVFEETRKDFFPELPSRKNSIYLTDEIGLNHWMKSFENHPAKKIVLKISATGSIHTGNQIYLDSDITSYKHYKRRSMSYWKSELTKNQINNEILFNGKIKIIGEKIC